MAEFNQFLANRLRAASNALHAACAKMPEERLVWHPTTEGNPGRDARDQLLECAFLNEWGGATFRSGEPPVLTEEGMAAYKALKNDTRDTASALAWLKNGSEAAAQAIEAFPAAKLGETFKHPFMDVTISWAEWADFFYWNTVYHEGQVNYIQVLYGDLS